MNVILKGKMTDTKKAGNDDSIEFDSMANTS